MHPSTNMYNIIYYPVIVCKLGFLEPVSPNLWCIHGSYKLQHKIISPHPLWQMSVISRCRPLARRCKFMLNWRETMICDAATVCSLCASHACELLLWHGPELSNNLFYFPISSDCPWVPTGSDLTLDTKKNSREASQNLKPETICLVRYS